jgi:hypothetical protein
VSALLFVCLSLSLSLCALILVCLAVHLLCISN